jgi:hypothetical protein
LSLDGEESQQRQSFHIIFQSILWTFVKLQPPSQSNSLHQHQKKILTKVSRLLHTCNTTFCTSWEKLSLDSWFSFQLSFHIKRTHFTRGCFFEELKRWKFTVYSTLSWATKRDVMLKYLKFTERRKELLLIINKTFSLVQFCHHDERKHFRKFENNFLMTS